MCHTEMLEFGVEQEKNHNTCRPPLIYGLEFAMDIMKIIFNLLNAIVNFTYHQV
jgi:hypothetical protein